MRQIHPEPEGLEKRDAQHNDDDRSECKIHHLTLADVNPLLGDPLALHEEFALQHDKNTAAAQEVAKKAAEEMKKSRQSSSTCLCQILN